MFLPSAWILVLRSPRPDPDEATGATTVHAQLRLVQLKTSLQDLKFARHSALGLAIYSVLACIGAWLFGDALWRETALWLLAFALTWLIATLLLSNRLGRDRQREYRNLRDLLGNSKRSWPLLRPDNSGGPVWASIALLFSNTINSCGVSSCRFKSSIASSHGPHSPSF